MIALTLTESSLEKNREWVLKANSVIQMVELRADFLPPSFLKKKSNQKAFVDFLSFLRNGGLKAIFTLRRPFDGGKFEGSEAEALLWYEKAVEVGFDWIDLDDFFFQSPLFRQAIARWRAHPSLTIIRSRHEFEAFPDDFEQWVIRVSQEGFLPKMAVAIKSTEDLLSFFQKAKAIKKIPKILLGMGTLGIPTRILTKKIGSLWSYSSFSSQGKALGHLDPFTLSECYRYHQIDESTEIYGIVGYPVLHSKSPLLHNGGFSRFNLNKIYLPFESENLDAFYRLALQLPLSGFSVTVPYKEKIISYLAEKEEAVEEVGSCNTVLLNGNKAIGYNTDIEGFLKPLLRRLEKRLPLSKMKVALIGAGGVARAILYALKSYQPFVALFNRNEEKAKILSSQLNFGKPFPLTKLSSYQEEYNEDFDLVIQATSLGMGEDSSSDPSEGYCFTGKEIVFEVIYAPEWTPFLLRAKKAGCETILGYEMLQNQAKKQFCLFSGGKELPL